MLQRDWHFLAAVADMWGGTVTASMQTDVLPSYVRHCYAAVYTLRLVDVEAKSNLTELLPEGKCLPGGFGPADVQRWLDFLGRQPTGSFAMFLWGFICGDGSINTDGGVVQEAGRTGRWAGRITLVAAERPMLVRCPSTSCTNTSTSNQYSTNQLEYSTNQLPFGRQDLMRRCWVTVLTSIGMPSECIPAEMLVPKEVVQARANNYWQARCGSRCFGGIFLEHILGVIKQTRANAVVASIPLFERKELVCCCFLVTETCL
jgi:hypothetical protein